VPDSEVAELRDVHFSTSLRGYDRDQVDAFVGRVNQVIAELQITAAPESAIRHALKQVTEETQGILERAHETADEITEHAKQEAQQRHEASENDARQLRDDAAHEAREVREAAAREAREVREAAQREAREVREAGEARAAELEADAQVILEERAREDSNLLTFGSVGQRSGLIRVGHQHPVALGHPSAGPASGTKRVRAPENRPEPGWHPLKRTFLVWRESVT
jgi:DivIVA domain-containing protein